MRKKLSQLFYSFPLQLLALHLRSNILLLGIWLFLTLLVTGSLGRKYGIVYLFRSPEYLGQVDFWSFFFVGFAYGAMVMSWNLTVYLVGAHFFPFLATLSRPFVKFCINNFIIPFAFAALLLYVHIHFEILDEASSLNEIFLHCLGFLFGGATLIIGLFAYFYFTNKDILSFLKLPEGQRSFPADLDGGLGKNLDIERVRQQEGKWRIETYLSESLRPRLVRSVAHYESSLLERVFRQNHSNALFVQIISILSLFLLGYLIDWPYFRIPASASIFLAFSILIALIGAITYWFHSWRFVVIILLLWGVNMLTRHDLFNHHCMAYGLDYETPEYACYDFESLQALCSPPNVRKDMEEEVRILNRWLEKVKKPGGGKPKLVVLCPSGGGLKSAVWTMLTMQLADSLTQDALFRHTALITGASGGMIGAAYYRELFLHQLQGDTIDRFAGYQLDNVSKDLLNAVSFTVVTNDLFLPWARFKVGGYTYVKDRGYSFERQLNENTGGIFNKTLAEYWLPEQKALIPRLFLTPAIINDGRRMVISPQGVSYMMAPPVAIRKAGFMEIDAVDFGRLFEQQNASRLLFSSALRMNATFPYILPTVYLPTQPSIEVMDAGFRDDFGIKSATRYLHVFRDWIRENTSGVILVEMWAFDRVHDIPPSNNQGVVESIFSPLGIAGQLIDLQYYEHDNSIGMLYDLLGKDMLELVRFTYHPSARNAEATISFHLTKREKQDIFQAMQLPENQRSLTRLQELLHQ
ncbi:MAG: patatin-like phospholipase family protein [Lewinellaceae bacterium]|nr:patatin-like phospholipase family protein [Lewinellaceae bacterium]